MEQQAAIAVSDMLIDELLTAGTLVIAAPGDPREHDDAQVPYLRRILQFMGISEVAAICADHMTASDEMRQQSLQRALVAVEEAACR